MERPSEATAPGQLIANVALPEAKPYQVSETWLRFNTLIFRFARIATLEHPANWVCIIAA